MKFTDRGIKNLKPREQRYIMWNDNGSGLGVRVSPKGRKTFIYMYRYYGKPRMMTLGTYPTTSLARANTLQAHAIEDLEKGEDPGAKKVQQRKAEREAETVKELVHEYIERYAKEHKKERGWKEDQRILDKDVTPRWGKRKAKDINRRDVIRMLDDIMDRGAPAGASRTLAVIRKMFNFALSRDIVDTTPCYGISAPSKPRKRERVLSDDEIRAFWKNLPTTTMDRLTQLTLMLTLVTGQRSGEVISARREHLNLEGKTWEIPATITKNKREHLVPLSDMAVELFEEALSLTTSDSDDDEPVYVFPSPDAKKHRTQTALSRAMVKNTTKLKMEEPNYTPHDLRRTFTTRMRADRRQRPYVGKILNHTDQDVTSQHYDKHDYLEEKKEVLEAWAVTLTDIIENKDKKDLSDNVVAIR